MDITVVIPAHPARIANGMLSRAIKSVGGQTLCAAALLVEIDLHKEGAAVTRNRGLQKVTTPWVAFLDSDDEFKPEHLETLASTATDTGGDYIYSWYEPVGFGSDPLPYFGRPFRPEDPTQTTITTLVRTDLAKQAGFVKVPDGLMIHGQKHGEDFQFTLDMLDLGATIIHVPARTWMWHAHGYNTSGEPTKGDAIL